MNEPLPLWEGESLTKLLQGDCLELMKQIPSSSVDMVLCDLPYGVTHNRWDVVIPFAPLWEEYHRVVKEHGAIVLFGTEPFASALRMSNIKNYRYDWIWDKVKGTGFLNAKKMPMRNHENLCVFYRKLPTYNPQKTQGHKRKCSVAGHKTNCKKTTSYGQYGLSSYESTERYPRSIQVFSSDMQKSALHPTQKPVALLEYMIRTYTNPGEVVLDNCMGSGSTGVACVNTGRRFIGMELDTQYFDIAKSRIEFAKTGGLDTLYYEKTHRIRKSGGG